MKIIRMQSRELIERFRKTITSLLLILMSIGTIMYFTSCANNLEPIIYDNEEQVIELLESNYNEFNNVSEILSGDLFKNLFTNENAESRISLSRYQVFKKYLSKDEYATLEAFSKTYGPAFYQSNGFTFSLATHHIKLFVLPEPMSTDDIERYFDYLEQFGTVSSIDDNWYCLIYDK